MKLKNTIFFFLFLCLISCQAKIEDTSSSIKLEDSKNTLSIGSNHVVHSEILNEDRPIIIALPNGYEESKSSYPILYLTDGLQNMMHVMGTVEVLIRTGAIPPIIVVGIESTNRTRDFTHTHSQDFPASGGGAQFLEFIETELIPYVEANYRTHPFRVLEGHSLGGLFTARVLMEKPDLFGAYVIMSPSFWWKNQESKQLLQEFLKSNQDLETALFFGIGAYESGPDDGMRQHLKNFIEEINANQPVNLRFEHKEFEREGHMSSTLLSNYFGLKSVFSDMRFHQEIYTDFSDEIFLAHENGIRSKYGKEAKQAAEGYLNLALYLSSLGNFDGAITVLNRSIEAYDFDINLRSILADTYEKNKQIDRAINTYLKAIEVSKKYNFNKEQEFQMKIDRLKNQ